MSKQSANGGNRCERPGIAPTDAHQTRIYGSLGKITPETEKWSLFVLVIFHHWLRYAEAVLRAMYIEYWSHGEENCHVLT